MSEKQQKGSKKQNCTPYWNPDKLTEIYSNFNFDSMLIVCNVVLVCKHFPT